jgi:ribosomal protein L11 methyltransferase
MVYNEVLVQIDSNEDFHKDLLINALSEIGFDTFEDVDFGFKAYIPLSEFKVDLIEQLKDTFIEMFTFTFHAKSIPHQNWNELWESNFEPIEVVNRCYIRATFHEPQTHYEYEIVIDPKMAFGTGHHQTTALMMEFMLDEDFVGQKVLDMGCGTGILAILASKMGATEVLAIDYDEVCFESTLENSALNNIKNIQALCGSKEVIPDQKFDTILANINRNILLDQLDTYAHVSNEGTVLFLSGFYEDPDLKIIKEKCEAIGYNYCNHKELKSWVSAKFTFSNK